MAFFQFSSRPACAVRWRRALPRTLSVFTRMTFTLNSSSTAFLICGLVARGLATMVYWLYFVPWRVPFSVNRAVLMMSKVFIGLVLQAGFQFLERALGDEQL